VPFFKLGRGISFQGKNLSAPGGGLSRFSFYRFIVKKRRVVDFGNDREAGEAQKSGKHQAVHHHVPLSGMMHTKDM
jgi:hypothetical protein